MQQRSEATTGWVGVGGGHIKWSSKRVPLTDTKIP
jgi:hypothetical protein